MVEEQIIEQQAHTAQRSIKQLSLSNINIHTKHAVEDAIKRIVQCIVRENLCKWSVSENILIINFPHSNEKLIAYGVIQHKLSRITMTGRILLLNRGAIDIAELLNLLYKECDNVSEKQFIQFTNEIINSITNADLTSRHQAVIDKTLADNAKQQQVNTLYDLVLKVQKNPALFFEQWASRGHPFHPCHKTKLGFSHDDVVNYAPEFNLNVNVLIAAIAKDSSSLATEDNKINYQQWFASYFPEIFNRWQQKLLTLNLDPDTYYPMPIHPWQAKNKIPILFDQLIENKKLIIFEDCTLTMQPTMSFRTLATTEEHQNKHIKLPVAIQSTSAIRTVSPASIHNSPQISHILRSILQEDEDLNIKLSVMYSSIGLCVKDDDSNLSKHLSVIFRDDSKQFNQHSVLTVVSSALYQQTPITQSPFIIELILDACKNGLIKNPTEYFTQLVDLLLQCYLDCYLKYGIAMEAHQQNTFILFKDKLPYKTIIRDLGGVRIHQDQLESKGYKINPYPNSATITHDIQEVRNKLIHTLYQCQIGELVILLKTHLNILEKPLWDIVADLTQKRFAALADDVDEKRLEEEKIALFQKKWPIKSLLAMRLYDTYSQYIYSDTENPMSDAAN